MQHRLLSLLCAWLVSVALVAPAFAQAPEVPYGQTRLGISDTDRDGTLYVPKSYKPGTGMPLVMMLHGFSGGGDSQKRLFALAEELGFLVIAPESRDITWGKEAPGFDDDVKYLGAAFRHVGGLVDGGLERKDDEHLGRLRLNRAHATRSPGPHLRAHVVDDRDTEAVNGLEELEVEVGKVDGDEYIRAPLGGDARETPEHGVRSRDDAQRLGQPGHRQPLE